MYGIACLTLVFGVLFIVRGPARAVDQSVDFTHLYAASVLWLKGGNPYDGQQCVEVMQQAGHGHPELVDNGSYYPPPTLAALSPLGLLSWDAARLVWLAINLFACGVLVWVLGQWLKVKETSLRWLLAVFLLVAWGPAATALSLGQLSIVAAASVFAGLVLVDRGRPIAAGLLIAVGCLIKPQLGLGFLLLILLRRHWLTSGVAVVGIVLVSATGIVRLMQTAPQWASELASNIARDQGPGMVLDASQYGPERFQMMDLQPVLHMVLPDRAVTVVAFGIVALLAGLAILKLVKLGLREHTLLAVSGVGLLMLMPAYHRYYDAVLLLPLLVLILNTLMRNGKDRLMIGLAAAMLTMAFPVPAILATLHQRGMIHASLYDAWTWQNLVMQHQSWLLLISATVLVGWTWRQGKAI